MRVFVTGGNGFIGSRVIRTLASRGHSSICLLRPTSDTSRLDGLEFERRQGDVRDYDSVRRGMEGADSVIHLAAVSAWDQVDSPMARQVTLEGVENILRAARESGGLRVVHCSSLTASGGNPEPVPATEEQQWTEAMVEGLAYAAFKQEAERMCAAAAKEGADVVVVIPAETYGPEDHHLITAKNLVNFVKSAPVLVCRGGASIAHVDDVALGVVKALESGVAGRRYILGGENVTLRELAQLTLRFAGKDARVISIPNAVLRTLTRVATKLSIPLPYDAGVVPYATRFWYAKSERAASELGVTFRSAAETLRPTVAWLKEAGHLS